MSNELKHIDIDRVETQEWLDSLSAVIEADGLERAQYLLDELSSKARKMGMHLSNSIRTDYINTIPVEQESKYPGDINLEKQISNLIRWNAIMIVLRASKKELDLGGHMASYQSASTFYEVGFNHIFKAINDKDGGDLVFYQGHISPGIYARAFLEGRLSQTQLDNFRQEVEGKGLSSYPHPKLMPDFWQFPTVSMGLGPISAIYQARFLKYLAGRKLKDTSEQRVYAFLGDGEMDEPESRGAISFAAREHLDNLCFLINCNLQRLDGPVMGNGKIIQELEGLFKGAGWHVIKVIWGEGWDKLLMKDQSGKLLQLMNETVDGDYQTYRSQDGEYIRKHFFGQYPETEALVSDMTDDEIFALQRGGHSTSKIYSAYMNAMETKNKPTVILAKTVKGYGMGEAAEGKNIAHQVKKMDIESIKYLRHRLDLDEMIKDEDLTLLPYLSLDKDSEAYNYLHHRRKALKGYTPQRVKRFSQQLTIPTIDNFEALLTEQKREISTTMAFVRTLNLLLKDKSIGKYIVPIIADEARTFGMEGLFRQIGIYNPLGQIYTPQDKDIVSYYKESLSGQVLQEGINELGAMASWVAAATSYSTNDLPMIPFYIYYSMFGFQRVGDMAWMAGDQQARGFLLGATSGRTTLNGEGLQHQDGHSHILANTIPNCISYDPSFAYEVAVIIQDGIERMYGEKQENIYYYITLMNENYMHPKMPAGAEEGIKKGIYLLETNQQKKKTVAHVQLLSSGTIMVETKKAAVILLEEYNISSDIFSVTSFNNLGRDGQDVERWNMLNYKKKAKSAYVSTVLKDYVTVAATDYCKNYAEQIRHYLSVKRYRVLGTDGFGRSDSRANLREYFEVDAHFIVYTVLFELVQSGELDKKVLNSACKTLNIDLDKINPLYA